MLVFVRKNRHIFMHFRREYERKIWPASANAMDKDARNTRRMRVYWKTTLVQQTLLS